jgi:DNA-binding NtrC family response regulator
MKSSAKARILIIDDDKNIGESLATVLRGEGYAVDLAENGQEAIKKSEESFYNLALIDLRLPDMDGVLLLTEIRNTVPKMVKIIITGYPSLDNAVEAINRGADGYMSKPYTMENLLSKIEEHLKKQDEARKASEDRVKEFIEARTDEFPTGTSAK